MTYLFPNLREIYNYMVNNQLARLSRVRWQSEHWPDPMFPGQPLLSDLVVGLDYGTKLV